MTKSAWATPRARSSVVRVTAPTCTGRMQAGRAVADADDFPRQPPAQQVDADRTADQPDSDDGHHVPLFHRCSRWVIDLLIWGGTSCSEWHVPEERSDVPARRLPLPCKIGHRVGMPIYGPMPRMPTRRGRCS